MRSDRIVIVTGLAGAGMSSTLKCLEDLGYEVFDNFPLSLLTALVNDPNTDGRPVAIGVDTRSRGFDPAALARLSGEIGARLVFLTCDETVLQKRFTETRRRHPLAMDRPVSAGIKKEQSLLHPLRDIADPVIDTTGFTIHDLKRVVQGHFSLTPEPSLTVTILSFGFKYGLPREADIVMDVRFLKNPHWEPDLKPLTGLDAPVQDYVKSDESFSDFLTRFESLLAPLLDRYTREGKSYLTIAIGCTGGKHRSVFIAETLKDWIAGQGITATTEHRDLDREKS